MLYLQRQKTDRQRNEYLNYCQLPSPTSTRYISDMNLFAMDIYAFTLFPLSIPDDIVHVDDILFLPLSPSAPENFIYSSPRFDSAKQQDRYTLFLLCFSVWSRWMEFYYSRECIPFLLSFPPCAGIPSFPSEFSLSLSLSHSLSLALRFCPFLSTSRLRLVTRVHSKRNYPMQRSPMYVCVRGSWHERGGPIGCAAIETSNKTFLCAKPICRQRPPRHLLRRTYQSRRRASISNPQIANRSPLRNLNRAPVFWLPFANIRYRIDTYAASSILANLCTHPATRVPAVLLGYCKQIGIDYRWGEEKKKKRKKAR